MTELKKNKAPTLFNENYVAAPLNTLKRTKNDFIDRKTVWRIAIFSFLLGTLISLFLLWFSTKQAFDSSTVQNKNPDQQSLGAKINVPQARASNDSAKNENTINDLAKHNSSLTPTQLDDLDVKNKLNVPVVDHGADKSQSEPIINSHSTTKLDNYSNSHSNNQSKHAFKGQVKNPNINKTATVKPKAKLKPLDNPTTTPQDNANKKAKTITSNKRNNTAKPKVDVIEQWINTHLKAQNDHNPFRILEQNSSNAQTANKKNANTKSNRNAD